jgi:hypothetical protein
MASDKRSDKTDELEAVPPYGADDRTGDVTGVDLNTGEHVPPAGALVDGRPFLLDPVDEFERLLIDIVQLERRKRADYASGEDFLLNFERIASATGMRVTDIIDVQTALKGGRIANLSRKLVTPVNETLTDTYRDRAIYSLLAYGSHLRDLAYYTRENVPSGEQN